jgi:hypothetical protein
VYSCMQYRHIINMGHSDPKYGEKYGHTFCMGA